MKKLQLCMTILATCLMMLSPVMAAAPNTSGMIYGEVTMRGGNIYKGVIRWGDEEFFWGDLFNSTKVDRPHAKHGKVNKKEKDFEVFGYRFSVHKHSRGRQFVARFGDIESIEITGRDEAEVLLKSGTRYQIDGGSNDVGGTMTIHDQAVGAIEVKWKDVETIRFMNTPSSATHTASRLYGRVETANRTFNGFVQWDKEECLSTDILNGHTEDGKMNIPMGNIQRIERYSRRSCDVVMNDGRTFRLSGTNDVNNENRGIMVETENFGRVVIPWEEFRSVTFDATTRTGPEYSSYRQQRGLKGAVVDRDGQRREGFISYDLDEDETWELLHGKQNDIEYIIPMGMIESIEPRGDWAKITLRNGELLELDDSADVNDSNSGVLIIDGEKEHYFEWDNIDRIEFEI